ncbi:hypothetical protein, partial [Methanothrix sp.]|uniref:hypothetical protein n=1 Tax=Methanothrix sp. TaxID=90426 RepID=UPI003BAF7343
LRSIAIPQISLPCNSIHWYIMSLLSMNSCVITAEVFSVISDSIMRYAERYLHGIIPRARRDG